MNLEVFRRPGQPVRFFGKTRDSGQKAYRVLRIR